MFAFVKHTKGYTRKQFYYLQIKLNGNFYGKTVEKKHFE